MSNKIVAVKTTYEQYNSTDLERELRLAIDDYIEKKIQKALTAYHTGHVDQADEALQVVRLLITNKITVVGDNK